MSGQRADSTAWPGLAPKGRTAGTKCPVQRPEKDLGLGAPLMQCRFPMLYQGADGPCDPATRPAGTPDQNAAPKCSACTFDVGRFRCAAVRWPYTRQSCFCSSNRDSPPHAASRFEEEGCAGSCFFCVNPFRQCAKHDDGRHSLLFPRGVQRAI